MHWEITNIRPEHPMFSALASNFPVRLGSLTNTQGMPHCRLPILASQNLARMSHSATLRIPFLEGMMMLPSSSTFTAWVGIDWADRKHDFCLQATDGPKREFGAIEHSSQAIEQWAHSLHHRFGGPIAICLGLAKGPLVSALQRYDFLVLFPVHPATLAMYRQAFVPSRAKDDPTDAEIALDILLRHREKLRPIQLQSADMRILTTLVEARRGLAADLVRVTNRITSTLKQFYPQVLDWFEHRDTLLFCDSLSRWPTLTHAKRARRATLESFFHEHNARRAYLIEKRI
jgi:hypothetical protein